MEIYKNTQQTITLDISANSNPAIIPDAPPVVDIYNLNNEISSTVTSTEGLFGKYEVVFPLALSKDEGRYKLIWTYEVDGDEYTRTTYVEVVQPYVTLEELRDFDTELAGRDDDELMELERLSRYIINAVTGQTFGSTYETIAIEGTGRSVLTLPKRLWRLDSVNYNTYSAYYNLVSNGISLDSNNFSILFSGNVLYDNDNWYTSSPITPPPFTGRFFSPEITFIIRGMFGWEDVPEDITLAAKLLARDFACNEDIYRRKKVIAINSGTWRMDFAKDAFVGTGNTDVDRILSKYSVYGMEVI